MWSLIYNKRGKNMERNKDKSLIQIDGIGKNWIHAKKTKHEIRSFSENIYKDKLKMD